MRNGRAIGLFLGTHLAAANPKPQGLTLSDRSPRPDPFGSFGQRKLAGRGQTDETMLLFHGGYLVPGHSLKV